MESAPKPGSFDKFNQWLKNSVTIRLISISVLVLLLLIPTSMIQSLIWERENRMEDAINEVSSKWAFEQTLTGPVIVIPFYEYFSVTEDGIQKTKRYKKEACFLPEELNVKGSLKPEKRYRGIYEVVVYSSDFEIDGTFEFPDWQGLMAQQDHILWNEAYMVFGLNDMRGLQKEVDLNWGKELLSFEPGVSGFQSSESGMHVPITLNVDDKKSVKFSLKMDLNGSKRIRFIPSGKVTTVNLKSDWKNPKFDGSFLPDERNVDNNGFEATWKVLNLNRSFPQKWINGDVHFSGNDFGVDLIVPVDHYTKSHRTAKYAIMFISLTFLVFFFIEVLNKKRIHPIQYILVGLALCSFYTLLISISEHLSFFMGYCIGALSILILIGAYAYSILKNMRLTLILSGILVLLYGFIYCIIQLQDFALLIGSIGLFLVLAAVMFLSRKVDWYNPSKKQENK